MGSLFGLLSIARDGIGAQSAGVEITGQNITNASTPGYVRRSAILEGNQTNGGVQYKGVARSFDQFTFAAVVLEHGKSGAATGRSDSLAQLEGVVAPETGGVGDKIDAFNTAMQALTGSPADPSVRATVLSAAQDLAQSVSQTAQGIQKSRDDMMTKAQGIASDLNQDLGSIAKLNGQIANATATGSDASALKDQRDKLVTDVSDKIGAKTVTDGSGQVTLFAAGTTLVSGNIADSISVGTDANGNMQVTANRTDGAAVDVTSFTSDGQLGGIREARDTDATTSLNQLDQFAYDFSTKVNAIQSAGYGTDGTTGTNMFVAPASVAGAAKAMALSSAIAGSPQKIAASSTAAGLPSGNDVAVQLAGLASTAIGASGTPTQTYAAIATSVGVAKQSSDNEVSLRSSTMAQAETLNSSASGVSLDEEMANLTQYQRAFQASSKVLQTADALLQALLDSV